MLGEKVMPNRERLRGPEGGMEEILRGQDYVGGGRKKSHGKPRGG